MAKKVGIEIVVDEKGAVKSLDAVGESGRKAGKKVEKSVKKASESVVNFDDSINLATISIAGMAAGVGVLTSKFIGLGIESFKNAERVETQFKTLLGSAEAAKERYAELAQFAASTPFDLNQVASASKILQTLTGGALASGQSLRTVGDAAAIAGVRFDELAVTVGRAYSGLQSNRPIGEALARLQELGIVTGDVRSEIEELQKQSRGAEAWEVLQRQLNNTRGGMEELSKTLEGKTSTLVDNIGLLSASILENAGAIDALKGKIDFLNSSIDKRLESQKKEIALTTEAAKRTKEQQLIVLSVTDDKINRQKSVIAGIEKELESLKNVGNVARSDIYGNVQRKNNIASIEKTLELNRKQLRSIVDEKSTQISLLNTLVKKEKQQEKESIEKEKKIQKEKEDKKAQEEAKKKAEERKKAQEELTESIKRYNNEKRVQIELDRSQQDVQVDSDIIEQNKKEAEEEKKRDDQALKSIDDFRKKRLLQDKEERTLERQKQQRFFETANAGIAASRELFGENKAFTLAEIGLNTARGITSALALTPPNLPLAALIGVTGAAQFAKASSQKYADGGFVEGSGTGRSDSINAQLSNGEFVVNARDTARNRDALENINSGGTASPNINITVNAGVGTDGNEVAQLIVNELARANTLGLEPSIA